jgi:hypothetical protein
LINVNDDRDEEDDEEEEEALAPEEVIESFVASLKLAPNIESSTRKKRSIIMLCAKSKKS